MLYIRFFHGRKSVDEEMDDWGEDGPIVEAGFITWTYGSLKLHDQDGDFVFVQETEGLIPIGNMYYGDFELLTDAGDILPNKAFLSLEAFEQLNRRPNY